MARSQNHRDEMLNKLRIALQRATQPGVRNQLQRRIDMLEGGGTKGSKDAFADAMEMARRRRKRAAKAQ